MTKNRIKPIQLGGVTLPSNVFYSPLAGCSDFPFRRMSARYSPGLQYCEMVKLDAIVRADPGTFRILDYDAGMHPIGAQLVGSKVEIAAQAARIVEDMGFDVIDYNCGCPVDKVCKDGSGSGMLKSPERIGEVLHEIVSAVKVPVTVKIRAGWDDQSINAAEITRIAEQAGAVAIACHGRTRKQAYRGPANWDYIRACVEAADKIKVIGNGDIFAPEDALRMIDETGCDAVLVSRGTMGQPWMADLIRRLDAGEEIALPDVEQQRELLIEHFNEMVRYHSDRRVVIDMRRVGCWYVKKCPRTREFRGSISKCTQIEELRQLIQEFEFVNNAVSQVA